MKQHPMEVWTTKRLAEQLDFTPSKVNDDMEAIINNPDIETEIRKHRQGGYVLAQEAIR